MQEECKSALHELLSEARGVHVAIFVMYPANSEFSLENEVISRFFDRATRGKGPARAMCCLFVCVVCLGLHAIAAIAEFIFVCVVLVHCFIVAAAAIAELCLFVSYVVGVLWYPSSHDEETLSSQNQSKPFCSLHVHFFHLSTACVSLAGPCSCSQNVRVPMSYSTYALPPSPTYMCIA